MAGPVIAVGDVGLGNRPGDSSLFQEPAAKEPAAAGGAPAEPEGELLQVELQAEYCGTLECRKAGANRENRLDLNTGTILCLLDNLLKD